MQKLCTLFLIVLLGCVTTSVETAPIGDEVYSLAAGNRRQIVLSVSADGQHKSLGNQYLFMAIPFGRVITTDLVNSLNRRAYLALSLNGYKPLTQASHASRPAPLLKLTITQIDLSGHDFVLFRRAFCKVTIRGELQDRGQTIVWEATARNSIPRKYAFKSELEDVFQKSVDQALNEVISNLGLVG